MKYLFSLLAVIIIVKSSYAQTNTIGSTGNVGIGTTNPHNTLHVNGGITSTGGTEITSSIPSLNLFYDVGNDWGQIFSLNPNVNWKSLHLGASSFSFISYGTNQGLFQDVSGNVGIGTTTPHQRLDLNGGSLAMGDLNATGAISFRNDIAVGTAGSVGISAIDAAGNGNNDGLALNISDGLKILNGTNTYLTLIASSGYVGIGTTTPREALSVNGNIRSKQIKVETANWPDYVFKPTYHLPSLSDVKTFIDQNQHLPEMPSQQEIEKNGLDLGEVVKLQTKKIEELTLYLIEQQQKVQKLEDRLNALTTLKN